MGFHHSSGNTSEATFLTSSMNLLTHLLLPYFEREVALCYVICDVCPTSSEWDLDLYYFQCYKEVNQLLSCILSTDGVHSTAFCSRRRLLRDCETTTDSWSSH